MTSTAGRHVYLLGAGFSRAISSQMPLMTDLADQVLEELGRPPDAMAGFNGDLESWLSYLASPQPWLSAADNLRNRALYIDVSEAIFRVIERQEQAVLAESAPIWLQRLAWHLSDHEANVLTFNYDLLFERACSVLGRANGFPDLYVTPLSVRLRPGASLRYGRPVTPKAHVRLHKLHGSINWYGSSESNDNDAGVYVVRDVGTWAADGTLEVPELYADLRPMVIPPVAAKGPFYGKQALRAGWIRAAQALEQAESLTIIGYSLPVTDTSTTALLSKRLHTDARVTVVDRSPDTADRVTRLLQPRDVVLYAEETAVGDYVNATSPHHVEWGIEVRPDGTEVPRILIDGTALPERELPNLADLNPPDYPDQWNTAQRFAKYVGRRWPDVTGQGFTSQRWPHPGGLGFAFERGK